MKKILNNIIQLNLEQLSAGAYLLEVESSLGAIGQRKIIKN